MKHIAKKTYIHKDSFAKNFTPKGSILSYIPENDNLAAKNLTYYQFHKLAKNAARHLETIPQTAIYPKVKGIEFLILTVAGLLADKSVLTHERLADENTLIINSIEELKKLEISDDLPEESAKAAELGLVLFFTSGTSGKPKIVKLTQRNIIAGITGINKDNLQIYETDRALCCLPVFHVYEFIVEFYCLFSSACLLYTDPKNLYGEYLKQAPTILILVPQILNVFYAHKYPLKLRVLISGGAPIRPDVYEFYKNGAEIIADGYGSTETSASILINGTATRGAVVRIADDGELLVKGPIISPFVERDADGWYHMNDLAEMVEHEKPEIYGKRKIKIIGRKGSLTKLQQGEYINLDQLSEIYANDEFKTVITATPLDRYPSAVCFGDNLTEEHCREVLNEIHKKKNLRGFERVEGKITIKEAKEIILTESLKINFAEIRKAFGGST